MRCAILLCLIIGTLGKHKSKLQFGKKGGGGSWMGEAMTAIRDGKVAVIYKIYSVEHPDEINDPCCSGMTPLQFACKIGSAAATRALVDLGADLGTAHDGTKTTPMMFASREGSIFALRVLLFSNMEKSSPLEKLALRPGWDPANLDARDDHGNTALMLAANVGHDEAAELLLTAGCDGLSLNDRGNSVWQASAWFCGTGRKFIDTIFKFVSKSHVGEYKYSIVSNV
jgi:ankyrin repeat protein